MDYVDSARFYPSFFSEDKVGFCSVFGDISHYSWVIDRDLSVRESIFGLIASSICFDASGRSRGPSH